MVSFKGNKTYRAACGCAGGNCTNGTNYGSWYLNLNNRATNSNWNIGASLNLLKSV